MGKIFKSDLALIHPTYIYHESKYDIFPLPWNLSHVGNSGYIGKYPVGPSWDAQPIGYPFMKHYIEENSEFTVEIHNMAQMIYSLPEDVLARFKHLQEKDHSILTDLASVMYPKHVKTYLKKIDAELYAVDLHWLVYSQGAIQFLRLIKELHPNSFTLVGGITAGYFREEIMQSFPFVDFLIYGDGAQPLLLLLKELSENRDFSSVPNVLYRTEEGIKTGPHHFFNDFEIIEKNTIVLGGISTGRGCPLNCLMCGGSKYSSKKVWNYENLESHSIDAILEKLVSVTGDNAKKIRPFLIHDPFVTIGKKNWEILLDEIDRNKLNICFLIEFFLPHSKEDILNIAQKIPGSTIHISPESMVEDVRTFQKNLRYSNKELMMNLDLINEIDSLSMLVWFMVGLAKDSKMSVDSTLSFIKGYYKRINIKRNTLMFNELLFLDPGSLAYEFPEKYDYKLEYHTFQAHMNSFVLPLFKYQINYSTKNLSRNDLFNLFLYMHDSMNEIYLNAGIISDKYYFRLQAYNKVLSSFSDRYDKAIEERDVSLRNKEFELLGKQFKDELGN